MDTDKHGSEKSVTRIARINANVETSGLTFLRTAFRYRTRDCSSRCESALTALNLIWSGLTSAATNFKAVLNSREFAEFA